MEGGNVVDAAVAASATLAVVRPHMTGLGGDLFCLIYLAKEGRVIAINASGAAPAAASIELFRKRGHSQVPLKGPLAIETPGCVSGWQLALERFGTMPLSRLLDSAVRYAEDGYPVTPNLSQNIAECATQFEGLTPWHAAFAPEGHAPRPGEILRLPKLARTLRALQEGGAEAFYRGQIAEQITAAIQKEGGLLAASDMAGCRAQELEPLQIDYRGYTVYEQPPVSQGHILLQELALAEGFDMARMGQESAEAIHLMVECKKLAFADRLRYLGDPSVVQLPMKQLLSREYAASRRREIEPAHAMTAAAPGILAVSGGDTTYHCVMDSEGNTVSMIQSLFKPFGSGVVAGETGITMNNRLAGFFLDPAHPNALAPGKRAAHTLNTYMLLHQGRPLMAGGTPGADDQVQVNFQVISNVLDHHMTIQEAIEAPRWSSTPGTMASEFGEEYELRLESRFPDAVVDELRAKGHMVRVSPPWSFGSQKTVMLDPESGTVYAGADPRRDAYAVAW
jgi:gamma-glutamyltranspeptidase / glutathione hydrolase